MQALELALLGLTVLSAVAGGWGIYWAKASAGTRRTILGRGLFILTLLALGAGGFLAALMRAQTLTLLGLVSGLLIVGMLWEGRYEQPLPSPE